MAKLNLPDIANLSAVSAATQAINDRFAEIEVAIDNTLSRDGTTPNAMEADLDLNSNKLLNVADPVDESDGVNLRSVRPLVEAFISAIAETIIEGTGRAEAFVASAGQTVFPLANTPGAIETVDVYVNGAALRPSSDFSLSGSTITLVTPAALNDKVLIKYTQLAPTDSLLRVDLGSSVADKGSALVTHLQEGSGGIGRALAEWLKDRSVSVKNFGAEGNGSHDDTVASELTRTFVALLGGGTVYYPPGTYMVGWAGGIIGADLEFAIECLDDDIHYRGAGRNSTIIKQRSDTTRGHVFKIGKRVGGTVKVKNVSITDMTIDGNRLGATGTELNGNCIDVSTGAERVLLARLNIINAGHYGIGMQRNEFKHCAIDDCYIADCGGDGIDWKIDTNSSSHNNIVNRCTVLRFGLNSALSAQAGIDVRNGVDVKNCYVGEYGTIHSGVRFQIGTSDLITTVPIDRSVGENITCIAGDIGTLTNGIQVSVNGVKLTNTHCAGNVWNYRIRSSLNLIDNFSSAGGTVGVHVYGDANGVPSSNVFSNGVVRSATVAGVALASDGVNHPSVNSFVNVIAQNNAGDAANFQIDAGISGTRVIGGSIAAGFVDVGTDTATVGVQGLVTPLKAGRTATQHILLTGDASVNKVEAVSVAGTPKNFQIVSDANSGDLHLRALNTGAGSKIRFGTKTAAGDAASDGYILIKDDSGADVKLMTRA